MSIISKKSRQAAYTAIKTFDQQWKNGLKTIAQDKAHQKEQIALAEEYCE